MSAIWEISASERSALILGPHLEGEAIFRSGALRRPRWLYYARLDPLGWISDDEDASKSGPDHAERAL
jgi:hypothetical protein